MRPEKAAALEGLLMAAIGDAFAVMDDRRLRRLGELGVRNLRDGDEEAACWKGGLGGWRKALIDDVGSVGRVAVGWKVWLLRCVFPV
jgi:hypothetical protein